MEETRYANEKPKSCEFCYFYEGKKDGCNLGEENCYYRLPDLKEKPPKSRCDNCCVSKVRKCIGFCLVDIANMRGGKRSGKEIEKA